QGSGPVQGNGQPQGSGPVQGNGQPQGNGPPQGNGQARSRRPRQAGLAPARPRVVAGPRRAAATTSGTG
ncbi:MAG: hypothetical protein LBI49_13205, partial [Nocardiopsaceae bacterium]|nr:hypothetical protein [Nocardiopsaceae bacterium]